MARISLRAVINEQLINRFRGVAKGSTSEGQNLAAALRGGGASTPDISEGLRTGARTFATAIQALNTGIAFLNSTDVTLQSLGDLTDKMIGLAEKAASSSGSSQDRHNAEIEYKRLSNQFEKIVDNAKLGEREFLTVEGIGEYLAVIGLDREKSETIGAVFDRFAVPEDDDTLASEEIQGERPVKIPPSLYAGSARFTVDYAKLFDEDVTLKTRPNAYKVLTDLKALRNQIDENLAAVAEGVQVITDNIDLVRTAGLVFLETSDQIKGDEEAEDVARSLRDRIRREVPAALAQAENLEAIVVAALAFDLDALKIN